MSCYYNMSSNVERTSESITNKLVFQEENSNVFKRHFLARAGHFALIPLAALTTILDTIIGVGAAIAVVATLATRRDIFVFTFRHLMNCSYILSGPFKEILLTINPQAKFKVVENALSGLTTGIVNDFVGENFKKLKQSENLFIKHVASRCFRIIMLVALVAARLIDFPIGVVAAPLALLTFGKIQLLNDAAFNGLRVTGIIYDTLLTLGWSINPTV